MVVSNLDLTEIVAHEKYWQFADAYIDAAICQCQRFGEDGVVWNYPAACVSAHLGRHAVELFLKGMLASRCGSVEKGHWISTLSEKYKITFTEPEFDWEIPFDTKNPIPNLLKKFPPDQLDRYPLRKGIEDWDLFIQAYTKPGLLDCLQKTKSAFNNLKQAEIQRRASTGGDK
ncbi:HEPN domain-containing protein [Ferribacterium limneticum]|uniref:hypothetical protein n=1 Tax=Ferribacterium limneticum TaxID=76259 RepID=UPI001CFB692B|nr:hypothetical protein [Ferribacterium limneticum]UCV28633.1 hypothetical protein KI617_00515 [Ferribacterium limneticum]UCV32550.1 hypothetical protein KI608_00515 [Ferribacterium limneticum]